ncbi:MAG: murein biosynthesis integral membrane protein MurJ [Ktedonobacteraceae bacterium]|nr:murein biosynthesis integral membrane protein MurJ [Ktedonobacteraceae bacterium]
MEKEDQQRVSPSQELHEEPESPVDIIGASSYRQGIEHQYLGTTQPIPLNSFWQRKKRLRLRSIHLNPLIADRVPSEREDRQRAEQDGERGEVQAVQVTQTVQAPPQATSESRPMSIGQAALVITVALFAARFLGLLRNALFTAVFQPGVVSDAYNQAFLVPNLIYNVVAGGALASAFIPVFNIYVLRKRDEQAAWRLASAALNLAGLGLIMLGLVAILFARPLVMLYNPGIRESAHLNLIVELMRTMMAQPILLGISVVVNAILYARRRFLLPAVGQLLYPVGLILGLLPGLVLVLLHQRNDLFAIYCAAWGVNLGAALMLAVQIPDLFKVGMRYSFSFDWRHPGIRQIVRLMGPRVLNAMMLNFSQAVDLFLLSLLAFAGFVTQYNLANSVMMIPLGMVMGVATALFPSMTEYVAEGRIERLQALVGETLRSILFLSIPSCIGLMLLSLPVVQVLYEHGSFTLNNAELTSIPLVCFSLGLPGLAAVEILTRTFYALHDSKTPVAVSIAQFMLKIMLSLLLINPVIWLVRNGPGKLLHSTLMPDVLADSWGMGALAFATSVAVLVEAAALLWLLHRRIGGLRLRSLAGFAGRILLASLIMGLVIVALRLLLDFLLVTDGGAGQSNGDQTLTAIEIAVVAFKLAVVAGAGCFVYLKAARRLKLLGHAELAPVQRVLTRLHLAWI